MIDEKKLAELRKAYPVDATTCGEMVMGKITLLYVFEGLEAALAVVRAAQEIKKNHDWVMEDPTGRACGIGCDMGEAGPGQHGEHDPGCDIKLLVDALAPFNSKAKEQATEYDDFKHIY